MSESVTDSVPSNFERPSRSGHMSGARHSGEVTDTGVHYDLTDQVLAWPVTWRFVRRTAGNRALNRVPGLPDGLSRR
jgi:hypothetical protein